MLNELYQHLDPVAFSLGPLVVRWYGIAYIAGFICAGAIIASTARRWRIRFDLDALLNIVLCVIVGVIVGARLGYVLFYGNGEYLSDPLSVLALNQGGMSFHGGLIGALLSGIVAARLTGVPYLTLADLGCIAAPVGLFFGRCANFVNGELWGATTTLPWGVSFGGAAGTMPRHPTQLYEALLEGVLLFAILFALSRRNPPRPQGTFLGVFLVAYGLARFAVEFVRQPDAQLGYLWGGWLTMGQVLSVPLVIAGIAVLAFSVARKLPQTGLPDGDPAEVADAADSADAAGPADAAEVAGPAGPADAGAAPESVETEGKEG